MIVPKTAGGFLLVAALAFVGCAAPGRPPTLESGADGAQRTLVRKRVTVAFAGDPPAIANRFVAGAAGGTGVSNLEALLNRGLSIADSQGTRQAQLAERVPSVDNGLWRVLPDGRMETTWKIRSDARWQDGTPFTSADVAFTARVDQDRELPFRVPQGYRSVEGIDVPDPSTVTARWKNAFIGADSFFGDPLLPKHLLESTYTQDKANFTQLSYWTDSYLGTGPYRLREWARGSHVVLEANQSFVLGRPKIDEIDVRFIGDLNTLIANALGGAVEMTLGGATLSIDQAVQARDQWREGRAEIGINGWIVGFPQLLTPSPAVLGDVQFRRALLHALDREQMAEGIQFGLTPVAHTNIAPVNPEYREIERSVVRYEHDPRKAGQIIESLGFAKGADGFYRDGHGQVLELEVRSTATYDVAVKAMVAVADSWQRLGVRIDQSPTPRQQQSDLEYRANFPALNVQRQPADAGSIVRYHSSEVPLPENGYQGESKNRYVNPELDALIDRYFVTVPWRDRMEVLGRIVQHMTDRVVALGLFYDSAPRLIANRLVNVPATNAHAHVHEWDIR